MSAPDSAQTPPQAQLMQMAMGFMVPLLLRAAAQLCLADHLADGPKTAAELAVATNAHAPALCRLLRTLASVGIFNEDEAHRQQSRVQLLFDPIVPPGRVANAFDSGTPVRNTTRSPLRHTPTLRVCLSPTSA